MPQNRFTNKVSAFIGFVLLFLVIVFTTLIIFFPVKTKEEILSSKTFKPFTQNELADLWELDSIQTSPNSVDRGTQNYTVRTSDSYYLGMLKFKTDTHENEREPLIILEEFEIEYAKYGRDSKLVNKVGNLFLKYQIRNITSYSYYGDFTAIHLIDGRVIILMEKEVEIKDKYYQKIIEKADFVNDSTKVILPVEEAKIYKEVYQN